MAEISPTREHWQSERRLASRGYWRWLRSTGVGAGPERAHCLRKRTPAGFLPPWANPNKDGQASAIWSGSKGSRGVLQPRGEYLPAKNNARRHPALSHGGAFLGRGRGGLAEQERPSERLRRVPRRLADKPANSTGRLTLVAARPKQKPRATGGLVGSHVGGRAELFRRTAAYHPKAEPRHQLHSAEDPHEKAPSGSGAKSIPLGLPSLRAGGMSANPPPQRPAAPLVAHSAGGNA